MDFLKNQKHPEMEKIWIQIQRGISESSTDPMIKLLVGYDILQDDWDSNREPVFSVPHQRPEL